MAARSRGSGSEKAPKLAQRMLVEAIGAFFLVLVVIGSIIATSYLSDSFLFIVLANGFALAVIVTILMNISGGHINPAVTIGMLVTGHIKLPDAIGYIIAQVIGATVAAFLLFLVLPSSIGAPVYWGTPTLSGVNPMQAIGIEAIITFLLVFTIFGTAIDKRSYKMGGFLIGLSLACGVLFAGPFTGGAANPARALGPAIVSGFFTNWYVYWIGPILGAVIAALMYEYLILRRY